jgi:hypothetical protein
MPEIVYVLYHYYELDDVDDDVKFIGIYATKEIANDVISNLINVSGFSYSQEEFFIESHNLDEDNPFWNEGFSTWTNGDWVN